MRASERVNHVAITQSSRTHSRHQECAAGVALDANWFSLCRPALERLSQFLGGVCGRQVRCAERDTPSESARDEPHRGWNAAPLYLCILFIVVPALASVIASLASKVKINRTWRVAKRSHSAAIAPPQPHSSGHSGFQTGQLVHPRVMHCY